MTQKALPRPSAKSKKVSKTGRNATDEVEESSESLTSSTLLEFPGVSRSVPDWRKQLSQRVREVQERKAREAAEELAAAQASGLVSCALPSGQLELVPDLEQQMMNPIVSKALERLERARRPEYTQSRMTATATAPALAPEPHFSQPIAEQVVDKRPRLTVVAPIESAEAFEIIDASIEGVTEHAESVDVPLETETAVKRVQIASGKPQPALDFPLEEAATEGPKRKAVRVLSDNDASLSYLENCLAVPALPEDTRQDIPTLTRRVTAGVFDLLLVALMVSPAAAAIEFSGGDWLNPRVFGLMAGITAITIFAYFTISVALTGRTLAMRMFSLRAIDIRTGLIPTGGQAIIRALGYVFSLALFGLGLAYVFIDPDRRTIYDRFSNTIVVRG
jgi:uncharacterized RDD family membrane protein YckC